MGKKQSKKKRGKEKDLIFYLRFYRNFTPPFQKVADKEISEIINELKKL